MKSALLVIAPRAFRDEEYAVPKHVLEQAGIRVVTASTRPGICEGKLGMLATAETSVHAALTGSWDVVAFIGGGGAEAYFDDRDAHQLAAAALQRGVVLAAICIAPSILARAGLLAGVHATAFASQRSDLIEHQALWEEDSVVVDGCIVTANGPDAAEEFGTAIVTALR